MQPHLRLHTKQWQWPCITHIPLFSRNLASIQLRLPNWASLFVKMCAPNFMLTKVSAVLQPFLLRWKWNNLMLLKIGGVLGLRGSCHLQCLLQTMAQWSTGTTHLLLADCVWLLLKNVAQPLPNDPSLELLLRFAVSFLNLSLVSAVKKSLSVKSSQSGWSVTVGCASVPYKTINKHHHVRSQLWQHTSRPWNTLFHRLTFLLHPLWQVSEMQIKGEKAPAPSPTLLWVMQYCT